MERIEPKCREDIPSRHLATVVVTGIPARRGTIELAAHLLHQLLRAFRLACEVLEIHGVVAGLIAVGILPNEAAGVTVDLA